MTTNKSNPKAQDFKRLKLSVGKVAQRYWQEIGEELLSEDQVANMVAKGGSLEVKLNKVISDWILASSNPTIGDLLKACDNQNIKRERIEEEYDGRMK
eukprot:m.184401 g.184401  ORF g.184401 m.184401 type:complete len:98 (+) comp39318_c4_seq36:793-1086(+)